MFKAIFIGGLAFALFPGTSLNAQETQTGPPAQPTPSIYNRMHRFPPQSQGDNQQQTVQPQQTTQQFPNPAQQFPPEQQQSAPIQRPGMNFPHAMGPPQQLQPAQQTQAPLAHGVVQPPAAQPPQTPYGLALQPANPPRIGFADGQLRVDANNSSLDDILNAVGRLTGAHIEGGHSDGERVFGQFGPGTTREVLNSLLSGSHYDYILVGAIDDPGNVERVMLTPHGSPEGAANASTQPARPNPAQQEQEEEANEAVVAPQPIVEPPQPPAQVVSPTEQVPPTQQQVKTPEQLLQELQRLRQQQQQSQQNPR